MIHDDVTTLAYYSAYRSVPRIVRVVRFTPTTVLIESSNNPFRRDNGHQKGGYTTGGHVAIVTPEVLDHIAAAEKQDQIAKLRVEVHAAARRQRDVRIGRAYVKSHDTSLGAAEETIKRLQALLGEYLDSEVP
jgi:hypothetical protein